jgi:hypothetical protein
MEPNESPVTGYMDGFFLPLDFVPADGIQEAKKGFTQVFNGVHGISTVGI